jgi:pimeloyl-ACP methyl ester carboxylesterase
MTAIDFIERETALSSGPLRVRTGGSGTPLVHLHSAAGPRVSPVVRALAARHKIHAPFLPGFDGTGRHASVRNPIELADLVAEFIRTDLGEKACDVVAESFGGWVALWLAARHPGLVDHLVLEAPAGLVPDGEGGFPADPKERFAKLYAHPDRSVPDARGAAVLEANRQMMQSYAGEVSFDRELAALLPTIKAHTLILMGTEDKIVPASSGQLIKSKIDRSRLTYIFGAAHALEFDAPDRVGGIASDFLERGESFLVRDPELARG